MDLVQFPSPVYISEIRIIPLGARVEADFPGNFKEWEVKIAGFFMKNFVFQEEETGWVPRIPRNLTSNSMSTTSASTLPALLNHSENSPITRTNA